jgi:DNA modification methylase
VVNSHPGRENVIIGGHFRLRELKKLGVETVDCAIVNLDEKSEKELNIRLNSNLGEWDLESLADNFAADELKDWGLELDLDARAKDDILEMEEAKVPALDDRVRTKPGDLWSLGDHRLLCGDARSEDDVLKLLAGEKASMVFTDPPYNVNFASTVGDRRGIENDNLNDEDFNQLLEKSFRNMKLSLRDDQCHVYVCCNYRCYSTFEKHFLANFSNLASCIVWQKDTPGLGWGYRPQHEFIIFGGDFQSYRFKNRDQSDLWQFPSTSSFSFRYSDNEGSTILPHPTMKPIALVSKAIMNSSRKNDLVLDLFGGSGSTLLASQQTGRRCVSLEIDPKFCDLTIRRWQNYAKKEAVRDDGMKFNDL